MVRGTFLAWGTARRTHSQISLHTPQQPPVSRRAGSRREDHRCGLEQHNGQKAGARGLPAPAPKPLGAHVIEGRAGPCLRFDAKPSAEDVRSCLRSAAGHSGWRSIPRETIQEGSNHDLPSTPHTMRRITQRRKGATHNI
jgi:hypothetical protein